MSDPAQVLRDFQPKHDFFIGIDSDGCVFDSMEIKHKECFAPMFVKHHNLQAVSKYAREVWDFVNLYSKTRGANRFPALTRALNLLRDRPEVQARNVNVPSYPALDEWMERETKLGNATLAAEVEGGNEGLAHIKVWSDGVNEQVADIVHGVPPFPLLRQTLEKALGQADMMVISQTPCDALEREWAEHDISKFVEIIAGQEMGTKTEHLKFAAVDNYAVEKILMIGDAPGDHKAAKANGVLFFPILPGREEDSWERLHGEALDRFFAGTYAGEYEEELFAEFDGCLPENPSW
ncbi:MAG TPA: haloacid dehalogenase [Verrucomicrobiales bacterium]|nr:haloacid dehalogenase [Verrucomicrobiales bacterium]|tara:strand:+ start:1697 stop:2575 length:879 start_codon:yes stop_codon:yes gene_type:complete